MFVHNLLTFALLAGSAVAKPVTRSRLSTRQYTNTSISGITQTSTDSTSLTKADTTPTCSIKYKPSEDEDCSDIATKHGIHLSNPEAKYDSRSKKCKDILRGYGICPDDSHSDLSASTSTSTFATATASLIPQSNVTSSNSTLNGTIPTNSTSRSNDTVILTGLLTLTELNPVTLTYTEGTGTAARERTVTITHTTLDVITETETSTRKANGQASRTSTHPATAGPGETPSAFPHNAPESTTSTSKSISVVDVSSPMTTATSTSTSTSGIAMAPAASTCVATVAAPASTQAGVVAGCTEWYVASPGDYCASIAKRYGIPVDTFMSWNPSVDPPSCPSMLAGSAYCVATCEGASALEGTPSIGTSGSLSTTMTSSTSSSLPGASTSSTAMVPQVSTSSSVVPPAGSSTSTGAAVPSSSSKAYISYTGDGSSAQGWPSMAQWIDFETMFTNNEPQMKDSCAQWGVPDDSPTEISEMKTGIQQVASTSGIDPRFILAIIMQESTGCVRVITTQYSVFNPGLMQSHNGTGSCNANNVATNVPTEGPYISNAAVQTPCPESEIVQMIKDGTQGTSSGDGLQQLLAQQKAAGFDGVQAYYRTARAYNGGSVAASGNLSDGCCTKSYASDVANRLTGWTNAPRTFTGRR